MKRESDRNCIHVNHARVHASAQSFDRCEGFERFENKTSVTFIMVFFANFAAGSARITLNLHLPVVFAC